MANSPCFVIVHCSDSPNPEKNDVGYDTVGAKEIDQWHVARGWNGIGYHWVIRQSGVVEPGRPETEIGAHCKGHNEGSIGICLVGRTEFTDEQKDSLARLFLEIVARWRIPVNKWFCHYQFDQNKTCPNIQVDRMRSWLLNPKS